MAVILPVARQQFCDGNGSPLAGGSVAYCTPGTSGTVYRLVWADEAETIPLINPVPLDASGITFSGGSQVSVWGFGQYELFVRDSQGNLIYSAVIDTPGGLTGGTINGSVQINGNLSVTGSITDTQSLNTPQITVTNATIGNATVTGGLGVDGNAGVTGSLNVNGGIATSALNTTDLTVGSANISNLGVDNSAFINGNLNVAGAGDIAGNLTVGSLTILGGTPGATFRAGSGTTDVNGNASVAFSPPFTSGVESLVACCQGAVSNVIMSADIQSVNGGLVYARLIDVSPPDDIAPGTNFFWIAVGV